MSLCLRASISPQSSHASVGDESPWVGKLRGSVKVCVCVFVCVCVWMGVCVCQCLFTSLFLFLTHIIKGVRDRLKDKMSAGNWALLCDRVGVELHVRILERIMKIRRVTATAVSVGAVGIVSEFWC